MVKEGIPLYQSNHVSFFVFMVCTFKNLSYPNTNIPIRTKFILIIAVPTVQCIHLLYSGLSFIGEPKLCSPYQWVSINILVYFGVDQIKREVVEIRLSATRLKSATCSVHSEARSNPEDHDKQALYDNCRSISRNITIHMFKNASLGLLAYVLLTAVVLTFILLSLGLLMYVDYYSLMSYFY